MCGAHIMPYGWEEIYAHLQEFLEKMQNSRPNIAANYNIRPTMSATIVLMGEAGPEVVQSRWGLIPGWWKNEKLPDKTFNARIESISDQVQGKRGMWGRPYKSRRCLVISGGYYEWTGEKSDRRPQFIYLPDNEIHAFAGMWEFSESFGLTHTIITATAAPNISHLHHRMPIILRSKDYGSWIMPDTELETVMEHVNDNRADELKSHEVSKHVNKGQNEAGNLEPVALTG